MYLTFVVLLFKFYNKQMLKQNIGTNTIDTKIDIELFYSQNIF